ncbi:MAG: OmpA family protein [Deltaproteobacteria bacterium]|nr:OmpA family protein [Deltaproteobacteria bacterium]
MRRFRGSGLFGGLLIAQVGWVEVGWADPGGTPATYLGAGAGAHVVPGAWDLHRHADFGPTPKSSPIGAARLGLVALSWMSLETELGLAPYESSSSGWNLALRYSGALLFELPLGTLEPFVLGGPSIYHNVLGAHGVDLDFALFWGVGARYRLSDDVALRLGFRHTLTDAVKPIETLAHNLELVGGVDFVVWRFDPDRDDDSVLNAADRCPELPGSRAAAGCPDRDQDGVVDSRDNCADVPGDARFQGCPDQDKDALPDGEDRCPSDPGPRWSLGCPDRDADGVADVEDRCPDARGPQALGGCPDRDGDSVSDADDVCPSDPGLQALKGCADRDVDGVPDTTDRCPDQPAPGTPEGCPADDLNDLLSRALEPILFEVGSSTLRETSFLVLGRVVELLQRFPRLRLSIEGHTDNQGSEAANDKLSEERAESVKRFLVSKGIEAPRLSTRGLGWTQPIVPNSSERGRATNRRIEFKIVKE